MCTLNLEIHDFDLFGDPIPPQFTHGWECRGGVLSDGTKIYLREHFRDGLTGARVYPPPLSGRRVTVVPELFKLDCREQWTIYEIYRCWQAKDAERLRKEREELSRWNEERLRQEEVMRCRDGR